MKVILLAANTYNAATDTAGYVTNAAEHAFQESTSAVTGFLRMEHLLTSVVSTTLDVLSDANSLTFGFEYLYADIGSFLEVIITRLCTFSWHGGPPTT